LSPLKTRKASSCAATLAVVISPTPPDFLGGVDQRKG
jgi:hypothetical protein